MTWRLVSLLGWHGGDYGSKDIQVLHYVICPWRRILNGACISISNLPENIAWQTQQDDLRLEARGPLKSGAWGGCPTCHPQMPPLCLCMSWAILVTMWWLQPGWSGFISKEGKGIFFLFCFYCNQWVQINIATVCITTVSFYIVQTPTSASSSGSFTFVPCPVT